MLPYTSSKNNNSLCSVSTFNVPLSDWHFIAQFMVQVQVHDLAKSHKIVGRIVDYVPFGNIQVFTAEIRGLSPDHSHASVLVDVPYPLRHIFLDYGAIHPPASRASVRRLPVNRSLAARMHEHYRHLVAKLSQPLHRRQHYEETITWEKALF